MVDKSTDVLAMLKARHCKQSNRSLYIKTMTHYYKQMLRKEPDVLELNDIIRLTGFSKSGVLNWLLHGDLPSIRSGRFYFVPKRYLLDFLRSPYYRTIAHISKQTALCLLKCGLVPCKCTGKKTRCYQIKMTDVIEYLENRERAPTLYSPAN